MSFFNRKKANPAPASAASPVAEPPPPAADNFVGDPDALRLQAALAAGQWREAHDFLESVRDWRMRNFYVNALAKGTGWPRWIDEWVTARPDSSVPMLFAGWWRVNWAWEARGGGRAKTVKQDAWPVFQARLVQADRDLARTAALDETDPTPLARSIWVAMGLSLGQAEVRRRFQAADQREHLNQGACYAMIQATARKWGGSHEAMFEFARWVSRESPEGSPNHKMIALAHIEGWLDAPNETRGKYFLGPGVQSEIRLAASRSVLSPRYPADAATWADRNAFAYCFSLMEDYPAALAQMELIGPRITPAPWHFKDSRQPGKAFEVARQRALLAASRARAR